VAVKNLTEEGFDVTGFDRNSYVGGLWHYTEEDKTSVLPSKRNALHSIQI
jgi:dimethylaniline monooxygenase (N-oxide forming)